MFISGLLPRVASTVPSSIALKHGQRAVTYAELLDKASRLARAFKDRGVGPGDRVALLGDPAIELVIAEHAAVALGAIPLGIYPVLAPPEIQDIIRDAEPAVVVFDRALEDLAARLTYSRTPLEFSCEPSPRCSSVAELIEASPLLDAWHEAAPGDRALIVYTGGSSGRPKGVVHTHSSVSSWSIMGHPRGPGYAPDQRSIAFNLAHLSGQSTLWQTVAAGGRLVFLPNYPFGPDDIVATIEAERVTSFGTVAGTLNDIISAPSVAHHDLRSMRVVTVGGAPAPTSVLRRAIEMFPSAMILVSYSLTESGQFVSALPANDAAKSTRSERLRSVGIPGRSVFGQQPLSMRIVDEAGRDVPAGSAGEILVAGPQVMAGYWNNPEGTERALAGGWLHTGDIARLDEDGYLYLLDRKRDIVIGHNGVNVYTSEVEDAIAQHPAIREVCVFGLPGLDAEDIAATVVVHRGQRVSVPELREFCAARIAPFKVPTIVAVAESLPRTGAGKIDRMRVRAAALRERGKANRGPIGPQDVLQDRLADLCERLLGHPKVGIDDDVCGVGGTPDSAQRIFAAVEELYGEQLSEHDMPAGRVTVRHLSAALTARVPATPVTQVQAGAPGVPPLFFCHGDVGGGGYYVRDLARALGDDQPVFVFSLHGLHGDDVPSSIEAIAADQVAALTSVSPAGPVYVGGLCISAIVAYEMARQLTAQGRDVICALLIEPLFVSDPRGLSWLPPPPLSADARRSPTVRASWLLTLYRSIVRQYRYEPYSGKVAVFWAKGSPQPLDTPEARAMVQALAPNVEFHTCPGTHKSALGRNVAILGATIRASMEAQHLTR